MRESLLCSYRNIKISIMHLMVKYLLFVLKQSLDKAAMVSHNLQRLHREICRKLNWCLTFLLVDCLLGGYGEYAVWRNETYLAGLSKLWPLANTCGAAQYFLFGFFFV